MAEKGRRPLREDIDRSLQDVADLASGLQDPPTSQLPDVPIADADPEAVPLQVTQATMPVAPVGPVPEIQLIRPWTVAAAMEPLPPLAPPPDRPLAATVDHMARASAGSRRLAISPAWLLIPLLLALALGGFFLLHHH